MDKRPDTLSFDEAVEYMSTFFELIEKEHPKGSDKYIEINQFIVDFFNTSARAGTQIVDGAYLLDRSAPLSEEARKKFQKICSWISENISDADGVKKKFN